MAEEINWALARKTFKTLCNFLDNDDWHYEKDEEKLTVECTARGDDLPIDYSIEIDAERELVFLLSRLPFKVSEDKRLDAAIAVSIINDRLANGCFDYNIKSGFLAFRMTNSFRDSELGEELFSYMIISSGITVDKYNDKLFMLSKGMLTLEKFIEDLNNN
ncbi:MAG: YbjN domain-containing protein [Faecalibacterium sp.]|nr:YbjN domain-containing protein [Ruminococcus sp.]MCM1392577.1 YbjN domain-containing protein [Ruminococcus sp.]MCM1485779.1 YbjN domain-containing protein [Faecalibacterium sp.]